MRILDAMILQMGRVASISIHEAIRNDYNAYHTHGFSSARSTGMLQQLQLDDGGPSNNRVMRSYLAALAHSALLQWYKRHKTAQRLASQDRHLDARSGELDELQSRPAPRCDPAAICAWYTAAAGLDPAGAVESWRRCASSARRSAI